MDKLFDNKGNLTQNGYYTDFIFKYKREDVKAREERMKEWDFFQFKSGDYILQICNAHALIFNNYTVCVFNIKTDERYYISPMKLHTKNNIKLIDDPTKDYNISYNFKNYNYNEKRINNKCEISFTGLDTNGNNFIVEVKYESVNNSNRILMIHPFMESKKMFYLNFKENYFNCSIKVNVGNFILDTKEGVGTLDYGRGYWPFKSKWFWGNNSFIDKDNNKIGWNIGYGFGIAKDSENIIYFNDKSYKVDKLISSIDVNDPMKGYSVYSSDGLIHLDFVPIYDNYSQTKLLFINKWCHQVYHNTSGYIIIDKKRIEFNDIISFFEFEENKW